MKKLFLLSVFLCALFAQNAQAQYITIPDANFRNVLKQKYPTCFNASNQLDTVCAGNVVADSLEIPGRQIANLEGVKYFKKLKRLNCSFNQLTSLPLLPNSLEHLECDYNQLTNLPILPSNLYQLYCNGNQLTSLPTIPSSLEVLDCESNNLTSLPALGTISVLICGYNQLTSLPEMPYLSYLKCEHNQLTQLPELSSGVQVLWCQSNQLTSLPTLPYALEDLNCRNNTNLSCLPFLPSAFPIFKMVEGTNITCLPNIPLGADSTFMFFPICNPTNSNSEICPVYPRIAGYVYNDANNNGVKDANEAPREGVKVHIPNKGVGFTNEDGFYQITVDSLKTYTAIIAQLPTYYSTANPSQTAIFTTYGETIMRNFPVVIAQGNIKDFKVSVNNFTAFARPGFPLHFRIKYENIGTIAGNATVKFAHATLYNVDSSSIAHSFSGDTLVWNFSNVPAGFTGYINVYGRLSASAVLGSTQNFYASVNQNDVTDNVIADNRSNLALEVRGSYDPNDKQGTRTLTPTQVANGEFIDYTIRFQNTGTDTAFTVVVADTLANNLQANTLEMIAASHNARTSLKGNIIYFEFLNILLPDSNVNEPMSHGFVKFRVKPKNTLVLGNTVKNKAAIYFDYNAPIITNTVTTTVAIPTGIAEKITNRLEVYPNPLEGEILMISNARGASAKLLTLTGKELRSWTNIGEQVSLQNVAAGMYLLEVSQNGQRRIAKVVVK
jgi:uncharacterized repeat protein (TIGR01451 family)